MAARPPTFPLFPAPDLLLPSLQMLFRTRQPVWAIPAPLGHNWLAELAGAGRVLTLAEGTLPFAPEEGWLRGGDLYLLSENALWTGNRPQGSLDDLQADLTQHADYNVALFLHAHPETGALVEVELTLQELRGPLPNLLAVVDVTHTLGRVPFYTDAWGLHAAFAMAGGYLIAAGPVPPGMAVQSQLPLALKSAFLQLLSHAGEDFQDQPDELALTRNWQELHADARLLRQNLISQGIRFLTPEPQGPLCTIIAGPLSEEVIQQLARQGDVVQTELPNQPELPVFLLWHG
jgi:hypothetical protein